MRHSGVSPFFCARWIHRIPRLTTSFTTLKARSITMTMFRTVGVVVLALVVGCGIATAQSSFTPGQWTRVTTPPQAAFGHALLLTDGSVLAITGNYRAPTGRWYRLKIGRAH